ncbi:MAG: hypothetical protein HY343_12075, partial [Lentisphaerae bacterium]|nr:hypothetical protein [Lentisphaerota bacterium]
MMTSRNMGFCLLLGAVLCAGTGRAATVYWLGGTNDWNDGPSWNSGSAPNAGDDVIITNGAQGGMPILSGASPAFNSLTIAGSPTAINKLSFTNWSSFVQAITVTITSNGMMTCVGPFANTPVMSNRVYVICSNLTVAAGGSINVDALGYAGGVGAAAGNGPGAGAANAAASHGGRGGFYGGFGITPPGSLYGATNAPVYPGSGGGGNVANGGAGGGAVFIVAGGTVTVEGNISANGQGTAGTAAGAGSGGSIYITTRVMAGNGTVSAQGGMATVNAGSGGGGRVAVVYDSAAQSASAVPGIRFTAAGGDSAINYEIADLGTLYFPDMRFFDGTVSHKGQCWSVTNVFSVTNLVVTNGWLRFPQDSLRLTVLGDFVMAATSRVEIGLNTSQAGTYYPAYCSLTGAPVFSVGGNVRLSVGSSLSLYGAHTNASTPDYGLLMSVTGNVAISNSAWIYTISQHTNGGSPLLRMSNLTVAAGGGIRADQAGFAGGRSGGTFGFGPGAGWGGPGGGDVGAGGGYGGQGGTTFAPGGSAVYGSSNAPLYPGSGGGYAGFGSKIGGIGGGLIRIETPGSVLFNGLMSANGEAMSTWAGGGSGGGIYIQCKNFSSTLGGLLCATGGASAQANGGGGGRISVWRATDTSYGLVSTLVNGGRGNYTNATGVVGTVVWGALPDIGVASTALSFRAAANGLFTTNFEVWNSIPSSMDPLTYTISDDLAALTVNPVAGISAGEHDAIGLSLDTTALTIGIYTAQLTIVSANGFQQSVRATFDVVPALSRSPASITNSCAEGYDATNQGFQVWNSGAGLQSYQIVEDIPWLSVAPTNGTSDGATNAHTIVYDTDWLEVGQTYNGAILIQTTDGSGPNQVL